MVGGRKKKKDCVLYETTEGGEHFGNLTAEAERYNTARHSSPYSSMELTFVTDLGQSFTIEIDSKMELENVMALLEAEVSDSRRCIVQAQVFRTLSLR